MYKNLEAELKRKGWGRANVADIWGVRASTASMKLNGKSPITVDEAEKLRRALGDKFTLDYLFEKSA